MALLQTKHLASIIFESGLSCILESLQNTRNE